MKIKTWLLVSYLLVMLLPLGAAYGLFAWINAYHQDRNIAEYMENWTELNTMQTVLNDPSLYKPNADITKVNQLESERLSVTLYTDIGFVVYTSNPMKYTLPTFVNKEQLYEGFYELQQKFGAFTYKEPVFAGNTLVGVYEVQLLRDEWVTGVGKRTWYVVGIFIAFFLALFTGVAILVNRKLNRPLRQLMGQMDSFAKGEAVFPLTERHDEIGELTKSFDRMRKELTEANRKLSDEQQKKETMIASISHDLKTPLTSIRAYAEALQTGELSGSEQEEYRNVIISKSVYMRQMLDDLLMYTLLQSSNYKMDYVKVDGGEFFDMLVSGYDMLCEKKRIKLRVVSDVTGEFAVNDKQLMRVVDNLMANAIAHANPGGEIGLAAIDVGQTPEWSFPFVAEALKREAGMYLIVQNEGHGLSDAEIAEVFDPLFQADPARTKAGERGTGLGLSITKQIMEKHGGDVRMVSVPDIGTAIICWLPRMKGEEHDEMDKTTTSN